MSSSTNLSPVQDADGATRARDKAKRLSGSMASLLHLKVIIASWIIALVPLAIIALSNYRTTEQALTTSANQTLFAAASQTAVRLDAFVAANLGVVSTEAQLPGLAEYLNLLADMRQDSQEKARVLDILRTFTQKDAVFISSYGLLNLNGRNVIDTDGSSAGVNESARDYFRVALETGLAYLSPVEFAPGDGKAYLYLSSVVVRAKTGKPVGVLRARYSAAILQQLVVQDSGLVGPRSYPVLLDENGLCLADGLSPPNSPSSLVYKSAMALDPARVAELQAARRWPPQPLHALSAQVPGMADSLVRVNSPEPYFAVQRPGAGLGPYTAAVARMKGRPWIVAFLKPQETLLAPVRAQARNTLLLAGVIALIVAITAIAAARVLTNPIVHLTGVARQVAEGNLDAKAQVESKDEIGVLAEAFNSMTDQLQALIVSLEQRVAELNRSNQALRESEERYRLVFESSPVSIWEEDFSGVKALLDDLIREGVADIEAYFVQHPETVRQCAELVKIVDVNKAALALYGAVSREELLAGLVSTFTLESFDTFRQELVCLWNGTTEMRSDTVVQTLAGETRNVTLYWSVCPGYEGTLSRVLVSLADITERKQAEKVAQARLRMLESTYAPGMTLDDTLRRMLDEIEAQTESLIGFYYFLEQDQQTLCLQSWSTNTLASMRTAKDKDRRRPVAEAGVWADCVRERRPVIRNDYASLPIRWGMPDGHAEVIRELVVPVFRGPRIVAIVGVGNKPEAYNETDVRIVSLLSDFSWELVSRKQAEEKRKESEERLRLTLEATQIGIFDWDVEHDNWYGSPEYYTMLGYAPKEGPGDRKEWLARVHPDHLAHVQAKIQEALAGESAADQSPIYEYEARLRHADGTYRWEHVKGFGAKRDPEGRVTRILGIRMDITERKTAEEALRLLNSELDRRVLERTAELEAANKEMHAFTYTVSHDLRAPLRHIDGFLELLQKKAGTTLDEQSRHFMGTISGAAQKMGLLIDDLLSFSRMGRHTVSIQQVDLGLLVRDVIRELEPDAAGRNIEWRIGDLPAVGGDASLLRMVLVNLISNALKFTRPRQRVRIEIGSLPGQGSEVVIFVRDNGVGFDMTYVDKLFGVFQRLHRMEEFEGTGIGLANVRRIIARHGGRTWAEGKPDQGAAFYFALPQV